MKIKVSEATPTQLDWLVAETLGVTTYVGWNHTNTGPCLYSDEPSGPEAWSPSTDWSKGGPIIEREKIELIPLWLGSSFEGYAASHKLSIKYDDAGEFIYGSDCKQYSLSPLISAMRCYAISKLGSEAEIPKSLIES